MDTFDVLFTVISFFLLGIERFLYGYMFIYPKRFEKTVRSGSFGRKLQQESLLWKVAMTLGKYIKIFQFSVVIFDLLIRLRPELIWNPFTNNGAGAIVRAICGLLLLIIGQGLNVAVFKALKPIGVYYGYEFGYDVKMVSSFPYNICISDPQYWGVVLCIWGIYLMVGTPSYVVPVLETFWYGMSMQVLENPRGRTFAWTYVGADLNSEKDEEEGE